MTSDTLRHLRLSLLITCLAPLAACEDSTWDPGQIEFEPDRPEPSTPNQPAPYTGSDPIVLEAQSTLPTGLDLHQKVIYRTCTPNGGVCHNSKEFPDLRTPANLVAAFGANCNIQYGEYQSVFDGCERTGDRFRVEGGAFGQTGQVELGWLDVVIGEPFSGEGLPPEDAPGLHIHFGDPLPGDVVDSYGTAEFERNFVFDGEVKKLTYATYSTRWWILPGRTHAIGEMLDYQVDQVNNLLEVGIVGGDPNRNGVFGARQADPVHLLEAGDPETSYLIARLRGVMLGAEIPGSRMPLANQPFTIPEMLALFCFVEGFPDQGTESDLAGRIDYAGCSYSAEPANLNLLGEGVTWEARISKVLEFNCGGCHNEVSLQAGLNLVGEGVYERLLAASTQRPELNLIAPNDPENSYLYLKLIGDDTIIGNPMPYNPLTGEGTLTEAELADVLTWITNGAVENQ